MTMLEIVLTVVVVIESGVLLGLLLSEVASMHKRRRREAAAQDVRIEMCESQIKAIFKKLKAVEAYIESIDVDEEDEDEGEFVSTLSELFGILSTNKNEKGETNEALPKN